MSTTLPRAILFDLDDTILAFDVVVDLVWEMICHDFAPRIDGVIPDAMLGAVQDQRRWYWSDQARHRTGRLDPDSSRLEILSGAFSRLGVDSKEMVKEIADGYAVQREESVRAFDGALETLQSLKSADVRLALVTNGNGRYPRSKVGRFGLARFFDCILIEGEFGLGKPDERVYRHALGEVGAAPADAWMVGDNLEWEVGAPQRLGMYAVWVDSRRTGLPPSTKIRLDRIILALPELLEGLG